MPSLESSAAAWKVALRGGVKMRDLNKPHPVASGEGIMTPTIIFRSSILTHAAVVLATALVNSLPAAPASNDAALAPAYRNTQPVTAQPDGSFAIEAEEFAVRPGGATGWRTMNWGENYYAATLANSFLSRKACLGAPEQCARTEATLEVDVPTAGRYLALVRYEAAYRFETRFRLRVEQGGQVKLDRPYGARDQQKIWAFRQGLKTEVGWEWGQVENTVWEGHDAWVELAPGRARLTLIAENQPEPAARRHVDAIVLTKDEEGVKTRILKENYLPLDGLLTQAGDVFLKFHNLSATPLTLTVPVGIEHSPYWIHQRTWKPKSLTAEAGVTTEWEEVGSLLDTLNDGQWRFTAASKTKGAPVHYRLEFGVKNAAGKLESVAKFETHTNALEVAYDANTRWTRRFRTTDTLLYDLLAHLKQNPARGKPPERTLIYGFTFDERPGEAKYTAAREEFLKLFALNGRPKSAKAAPRASSYIDVRSVSTPKLNEHFAKLKTDGQRLEDIRVVSLGDEIGLGRPPAKSDEPFREWAKARDLKPSDLNPASGGDWSKVTYDASPSLRETNPRLFYFAQIYAYHFGIQQLKERTDLIKRALPNADTGANFSPHHGPFYLGDAHMWISLFRQGGMTMPWSEDYIFQVPVGSQQMNNLLLDLARAANRYEPRRESHFYVMPHMPGNRPESWRRLFYGALGHGMTIVNLFEFRPVQAAYTENYVNNPAMFVEVRRAFHELATFEDIVQDGRPRWGKAALWYSQTGDVWQNHRAPFGPEKRSLAVAVRHQQTPLDIVEEEDALRGTLAGYSALYLTDANVSQAASRAMVDWVQKGGQLFATAGAGMLDEFNQPNTALRPLFGVLPQAITISTNPLVLFEKTDLPFCEPLDQVTMKSGGALPVFAALGKFTANGSEVLGSFRDGSPAVVARTHGAGRALYCGFLPALTYFQPAMPKRPGDRTSAADSLTHFIPTQFHAGARQLIGLPVEKVARPVVCSEPLVEANLIESKSAAALVLVNWTSTPLKGLQVTLQTALPQKKIELASGGKITTRKQGGQTVLTLDLAVADTVILR